MADRATYVRLTAVASVLGLCLVVVAVATVALVAEAHATWRWYFRMERVMAVGTPVALGLLGLSFASGFALVFVAAAD